MAEPHEYCPEIPLGDMEVGTILIGIGEDLQKNGDREKAREQVAEVLENHLTKVDENE